MFKVLLSLALVALVVAVPFKRVPKAFREGRIVGGVEAKIEDFPYQVSVRFYGYHMCGGSLLDERTILTAAHCTNGVGERAFGITVGSNNLDNGDFYQVENYIQHPKYSEDSSDYDVAILKLASSIPLSNKVAPIALQEEDVEVKVGSEGVISGWGDLFEGDGEYPTILRSKKVDVISTAQCQEIYSNDNITDRMLCAQHDETDWCRNRDTGGPLVVEGKQVGIISWGYGCANPRFPGVYSKVSNLRSWIEANRFWIEADR